MPFPKPEFFYIRNVDINLQNNITAILRVHAILGTGKYLGLLLMVDRSKKATFSFIKDRVWQKINSWSSKFLLEAGREGMIKYALQTISSYVMSVFLLSTMLIDVIEKKMINGFRWRHGSRSNKGIHWLSW